MTESVRILAQNLVCGNETLGCDTVEAMFLHRCCPNAAPVHQGVDKAVVEETEDTVAEGVGEGAEACHIELNTEVGEHHPMDQIWCLENPSCIVLLKSQAMRFTKPERKQTHYIRGVRSTQKPRVRDDFT